MQMARMLDPSRGPKSYSLAKLTQFYEKQIQKLKKEIIKNLKSSGLNESQSKAINLFQTHLMSQDLKVSMKDLFQSQKLLKSGELGKTMTVRFLRC